MIGGQVSTTIAETDWTDPDSVSACARRLLERRDFKADVETEAFRNLAFLAGLQWHKWNGWRRKMERDEGRDPSEVRLIFNFIEPLLEHKLAKLIRSKSVWDPAPGSTDDADRAVARVSKDLLGWYYEQGLKMPRVIRQAALLAMTTKTAFIHAMWDPRAGDSIVETPQQFQRFQFPEFERIGSLRGSPVPLPQGSDDFDGLGIVPQIDAAQRDFAALYGEQALQMGRHEARTGDVRVEVASLFEIWFWPFTVKRFEDARIWMRATRKTADEWAEDLGVDADEIRSTGRPPEDANANWVASYNTWDAMSRWSDFDDQHEDDMYVGCLMYHVASGKYPRGRYAIVVGERCFHLGDNPYRHARVPLFPLAEKHVPDYPWGACTVDSLVSPQSELNLAISQRANYRNRKVNPTIVRRRGDADRKQKFTNRAGAQFVINDWEDMPRVLQMPDLGGDHERTITQSLQFMQEISGTTSVDLGGQDKDQRSGRAVNFLQEMNNRRLAAFGEEIDEMLSAVGTFILEALQDFLTDERTIQIAGENNRLEVMRFRGSTLWPSTYGQPNMHALVRCNSYRNIPNTTFELRALLGDAVAVGMLDPRNEADRRKYWLMLGLGDERQIVDQDRVDIAAEQGEIDRWRRGENVGPPREAERHRARLDELERWIVTDEFRQLIERRPELAIEIEQHRRAHAQAIADQEIRREYDVLDAHIRNWMERRAKWKQQEVRQVQELAAQGVPPDEAMQRVTPIADLFYRAPLIAMGTGAPERPVESTRS